MKINLTEKEKKQALSYVRNIIRKHLGLSYEEVNLPDNPVFEEEMGVFVTLTKNGDLRGCIGYPIGFKPLKYALEEVALSAAFEDPRFLPLTKEEIDKIEIEITILGKLEKTTIDDIVIGRDGLYIKKGYNSGLLLPQVPLEYGWDKYEFLENTCLKAGLYKECYKDEDTLIYKFEGYIFREGEV